MTENITESIAFKQNKLAQYVQKTQMPKNNRNPNFSIIISHKLPPKKKNLLLNNIKHTYTYVH